MSGNMSALNNEVNGCGPPATSTIGNMNGDRRISYCSLLARGSLQSPDNQTLSSIHEDKENRVDVEDNDVWGNRILLSALESVVFAETPFRKLTAGNIYAFQKLLLTVNAAAFHCNPFIEQREKSFNTSHSMNLSKITEMNTNSIKFKISKNVMDELNALPLDTKIVIRSLVSSYLRNLSSKIVEMWMPILEPEGISSSSTELDKQISGGGGEELDVKGSLNKINTHLKAYQTQSYEIEVKAIELSKRLSEEREKLDRDTNNYKRLVGELMEEESAQNDPELLKTYEDFMHLEKKCLIEELRLEELKQNAEENPATEQEETKKLYDGVKALYEIMLVEVQEMEERYKKYKSLGSAFSAIRVEYKDVEEQIESKEWVKEQLENGPKDDSLFGESF